MFPAELTITDLETLFENAIEFAADFDEASSAPCVWFYRNTKKKYFDESLDELGGIMEVRLKDNCGDPASPINNKLKGLFFSASPTDKYGNPPPKSPFGPSRLQVPAEVMLDEAPNVYFADFYCLGNETHYLTLVMTKSHSWADDFCRNRLLPVDLDDRHGNPFLFRDDYNQLRVYHGGRVCVEIFYTENIDIEDLVENRGAERCDGISQIPKSSNPKYKNLLCAWCNVASASDDFQRF